MNKKQLDARIAAASEELARSLASRPDNIATHKVCFGKWAWATRGITGQAIGGLAHSQAAARKAAQDALVAELRRYAPPWSRHADAERWQEIIANPMMQDHEQETWET